MNLCRLSFDISMFVLNLSGVDMATLWNRKLQVLQAEVACGLPGSLYPCSVVAVDSKSCTNVCCN
jgi:hypothetical protein